MNIEGAPAPAPDLSIRARPPSPRRLSRKVLLAGVLGAGAVIGVSLLLGLSDRPPRAWQESDAQAASAGPPETIAQASDGYDPASLDFGESGAAEELTAPSDPIWREERPPAPRSEARPSPVEVARASPLVFASIDTTDAGEDADRLSARIRAPRSRYELLAGSVIPAALLTELNSDLPGQVIAQVTAPVLDSVSGQYLLVPQGARLIGVYDNGVRHGDQRLLLRWRRLIFPDGSSIRLDDMPGGDPAGASGVRAAVDNHFDRLAVAIGLSAIVSLVANEAEDDDSRSLNRSVGDAAAEQAAATGGRIVDRELAIRPTLRVPAGALVRVLVTRDIELRPYRGRVE